MTYDATNWPPMNYPGAASETGNGGTAAPSDAPPSELPSPDTEAVDWNAAAPPVNDTAKESPVTTQQGINSFFGIIDPRLDSESA